MNEYFTDLKHKLMNTMPDKLVINGRVLPDFPTWKIYDESIWSILDSNKRLQKIVGTGVRPASQIGELFTVHYKVDKQYNSEDYPAWSPIVITLRKIVD